MLTLAVQSIDLHYGAAQALRNVSVTAEQQLAIGRALVTRPKLLLLDEPTEGIQPSIIKEIGRAIVFLKETTGMAILLVEQYLDFCRQIADHVYVMDRGDMVHSGPATDLDDASVRRHLTV